MYRIVSCILIYLSMTLPAVSTAGALEKYSVPIAESGSTVQPDTKVQPGQVNKSVYVDFRKKIKDAKYTPDVKKKLVKHFREKVEKARREGNTEAISHYEQLIGIIKTSN